MYFVSMLLVETSIFVHELLSSWFQIKFLDEIWIFHLHHWDISSFVYFYQEFVVEVLHQTKIILKKKNQN